MLGVNLDKIELVEDPDTWSEKIEAGNASVVHRPICQTSSQKSCSLIPVTSVAGNSKGFDGRQAVCRGALILVAFAE